MNSLKSRL